MSHWTVTKIKIKDLTALEAALNKLGLTSKREHVLRSEYGQQPQRCALAFADNSANLDRGHNAVGVVRCDDGTYEFVADFYGNRTTQKLGGNEMPKLMQEYAVQVTMQEAAVMGAVVSGNELMSDGSIVLTLQVY